MSETVARGAQHQLSALLQARDPRAFCDLYDATVSYVYNLARCVGDDPAWAECVTEAVFAEVWRSPETVDARRGSLHEALATLVYQLSTAAPARESGGTTPQRARAALASLTPAQRDAVNAVYFGGQSMSAAAANLGTTVIDVARDTRDGLRVLTAARLALPGDAAPDVA